MSNIQSALLEIQNLGLDKIRCCLTGAPYATIEVSEINDSLRAEVENDPQISIERLVDQWQLKALTFNSQALPVLRGVNDKSLLAFMRTGHSGQVKALTYLLTRLLFPHLGAEPLPTETARERMLFATHLYDASIEWEAMKVSGFVQQLVVVDSYLAMPYWHTLWAFESVFSKYGIAKAPVRVRETFDDPLRVTEDVTRIDAVINYMYELMLYVAERDGGAGRSGNRLAQQIMFLQAERMGHVSTPHFQKKEVTTDQIWKAAWERKVNGDNKLRVAHSAIHGKGHEPGAITGASLEAMRLKKNLKQAREAKMTPEQKLKSKLKGAGVGGAKKAPKVSESMQSAFNALQIDPEFAAKMAALIKKD